MNTPDSIDNQNRKTLIIITKDLVVYYHNFKDGLCYNKINLSIFENSSVLKIT